MTVVVDATVNPAKLPGRPTDPLPARLKWAVAAAYAALGWAGTVTVADLAGSAPVDLAPALRKQGVLALGATRLPADKANWKADDVLYKPHPTGGLHGG
jgi:hypothetical protein